MVFLNDDGILCCIRIVETSSSSLRRARLQQKGKEKRHFLPLTNSNYYRLPVTDFLKVIISNTAALS